MTYFQLNNVLPNDQVGNPNPTSGLGPVAAINANYDEIDDKLWRYRQADRVAVNFPGAEEGQSFSDNRSDWTDPFVTPVANQKSHRLWVFDGAGAAHKQDSRFQETWGADTNLVLTSPYVQQASGSLIPRIRKSNYGRVEIRGGVINTVSQTLFPTGVFTFCDGQLPWATWGFKDVSTLYYKLGTDTPSGAFANAQLIVDNNGGFVRMRAQYQGSGASGSFINFSSIIWDNGYTGVTN